ncbi:MAG: hypothetical protein A4E28_01769 [Methanocella sp. PtaU1.Bin125]|nr:MAG: hypothetical protein A4E28_01769 [Methanocella sp. PtaU1.Bin125]
MRKGRFPGLDGTDGQWLLLSAIVVSIGLGALVLLLNMAILSGHSSTQSIMSFPKNQIRDLRYNCVSEAGVIGSIINRENAIVAKTDAFNQSFGRFVDETGAYYASHGALTSVDFSPHVIYNESMGQVKITNVTLNIMFYDGTTTYTENTTVGII